MLKKYLKEGNDRLNEYVWQVYLKKFKKNHDLFATFDKDWQEKIYKMIDKYASANIIYYFACATKGVNTSRLEDAIIKTNNANYILYFARNVKGANKKRLMQRRKELKKK